MAVLQLSIILYYDTLKILKSGLDRGPIIAGYMEVEYVSAQNGGLSFVVDQYTKIVKLIRYKRNRKGSTWALHDIKEYNLLPYLR